MACAVDCSALGSACADFDRVLLGEQGCVCVVLFRFCVAGRASIFGGLVGACFGIDMVSAAGYGGGAVVVCAARRVDVVAAPCGWCANPIGRR